jgi:membrane protein
MASGIKAGVELLKETGSEWIDDNAPRLGAALSFYTIFAIPPLFVIVLFIAGLWFGEQSVRTQVFEQLGGLIGQTSAEALQSALVSQQQESRGLIASIIAIVTLVITSTGLFIELQSALNWVWGVKEKPGQGIRGFIRNRVLSFTIVIGIGFLLLVSLILSAALAAFSQYLSVLVPGLGALSLVANVAVAFAVITLLFAMIFKVLPDVKIAWRDVWIGAALTALLFTAGKFALGMYLGKSEVASAYGAAGSLVIVLLWVYYSAQILFFGAEFTQVYANRYGAQLVPKENAEWIMTGPNQQKKSPRGGRRSQLLSELRDEVESLRALVQH